MKINARFFHPLRGHVEAGNIVVFPNRHEFTIHAHGVGKWILVDGETKVGPFDGAYDLASGIAKMEGMSCRAGK